MYLFTNYPKNIQKIAQPSFLTVLTVNYMTSGFPWIPWILPSTKKPDPATSAPIKSNLSTGFPTAHGVKTGDTKPFFKSRVHKVLPPQKKVSSNVSASNSLWSYLSSIAWQEWADRELKKRKNWRRAWQTCGTNNKQQTNTIVVCSLRLSNHLLRMRAWNQNIMCFGGHWIHWSSSENMTGLQGLACFPPPM